MPNDFLEKTLEDIIYNNRTVIHTRGFGIVKENAFRQVILPSGKRIDILGFEISDGCFSCDIYELKRDTINADAICQAFNYYTELKCVTDGHFSNFKAKIIMVGRKYEPVSIIDSLPVKIEVYTYEYHMDGIKFFMLHNPYVYSQPNMSFSFGLWAFGYAGLSFREDKSSISFHSVYDDYKKGKPDFEGKIKGHISSFVKQPKQLQVGCTTETVRVIEKIIERVVIKPPETIPTEVFPQQPSWTKEFAAAIPHNDILEDSEMCDFDCEIEEDNDLSDFEPSYDDEEFDICGEVEHEPEFIKSKYIDSLTILIGSTIKRLPPPLL